MSELKIDDFTPGTIKTSPDDNFLPLKWRWQAV